MKMSFPEQLHSILRTMILLALLCSFSASTQTNSAASQSSTNQSLTDLKRMFQNPPMDSRIMMRWWWFGPAVTKSEIEREMRLMKEGGIGGFEVQPVYPLALDSVSSGIKTLPFLSDEFIDALRFTSEKARELGLRFDLTLGSGWPYGGPPGNVNEAASRLRVERVKLMQGARHVPVPSINNGEKLIAVFFARSLGKEIVPES